MLYTAVYADIQAQNVKTQGGGETQVFGSERYMKKADIYAHIH